MDIVVLGCGPAGLAAVHALNNQWKRSQPNVHVFSRKRKSQLYGAQYLHAPLPFLREPVASQPVSYSLVGSADEYRRKVYGDQVVPQVSPQALAGEHKAWDIRHTYDQLWDMYSGCVTDTTIDAAGLRQLLTNDHSFSLVINTLPLNSLCDQGHQFASQDIYAMGSKAPNQSPERSYVVCNGERSPAWYRRSCVFGYETYEWPGAQKPPISGAVPWTKPIKHNCTCWPWTQAKMLNVGRYGAWRKGYLVHHVYEVVSTVVDMMGRRGFLSRLMSDPNHLGPWVK